MTVVEGTADHYFVRFGYHKCLTRFMAQVFPENRHYRIQQDKFINHLVSRRARKYVSLNNRALDLRMKIFDNTRIIHLIRHPKDLVVSGYFYHRRGAEHWCRMPIDEERIRLLHREMGDVLCPKEQEFIAGHPTTAGLLSRLPQAKGLMAEMVWLKHVYTFEPLGYYRNPRVRTFRFEDIMADPEDNVAAICDHWGLADHDRAASIARAAELMVTPSDHIRDRSPRQYPRYFVDEVERFYARQFGDIHLALDYT